MTNPGGSLSESPAKLTDTERRKARKIALNPMEAPVTLDTICLLSLALRDAEDERSVAWKANYELKVKRAQFARDMSAFGNAND